MKIRHLLLSASVVLGATSTSFTASAAADPLLGQTMTFGGNFCPRGWQEMNGALLPIASHSALFSILGTYYGGDGRTTFAVPDARGRAIVGVGQGAGLNNVTYGQMGGTESFVLTESNMPSHTHRGGIRSVRTTADSTQPGGNSFGTAASNTYVDAVARGNFMSESTLQINPTGGGQAVLKRSPYLGMVQCIALQGVFPSRN